MSSTYTLYPPGPDTPTTHQDQLEQSHNPPSQDPQYLNPFSPQLGSNSASPAFNTHTPAESVSTLSIHYQSSEFSEGDDPFFGLNFNALEGASPSFLAEELVVFNGTSTLAGDFAVQVPPPHTQHVHPHAAPAYLPLSPDKSPSLPGASPNAQTREAAATRGVFPDLAHASISPRELSLTREPSPTPPPAQPTAFEFTPGTLDSTESSDDGLAAAAAMQSPRVTVSHWDKDNAGGSQVLNGEVLDGHAFSAARDSTGRWIADQATGQSGVDPSARSAVQTDSINELANQRKLDERNQEVDDWLQTHSGPQAPEQPLHAPEDEDDNISPREISLGYMTENKPVPGQTYLVETGGELTDRDLDIIRQGRNWEDAPVPFPIYQPEAAPYQPQTSQAAMEKYHRMCRDNDSIVSRAATWGTRRYSLPSLADVDIQAAGNLFKKLSLNRGDTRRPSILQGIRGLVRKPSNSGKRSRPEPDDTVSFKTEPSVEPRETPARLAPPSPRPGWPRKNSVPSINTAFINVGSQVASIGATHARTSSVSAVPIASPRSPGGLGLSVKKPLNRLRSKSDTSGIVDLWKKTGGPPVSNLVNTKPSAPEADDDEDDEEDLDEDPEIKAESNKLLDDIAPNFAGFQQHVLKLNPLLATTNNYLVDRIAHQQVIRYKGLLNLRIKHLQAIAAKNCSCGTMCISQGGSANVLDARGDQRGLDPLSARYDGSDGDMTPLEGAINPDSFPQDIPMPPTGSLPAEFECQLCFSAKKFQKPSDWTKHVHEDVQPFTCTWDRCKEPKMFKRKADWVRHENEGHRHLEWWTCDVEDCRHKCYRRDNFLQHLVREHKFIEPRVKTKAAIKRAGGIDPTWAKVEQCHQETPMLPQQEPCRFCGKCLPSWKKLTVHLAKHMEHISLPVLKLVAKKDLDEDTIISPVQEPPPRSYPATFPARPDHLPFHPSPPRQGPMPYPSQPLGMYPIAPPQPQPYQPTLFSPTFNDLHGMAHAPINMQQPPMPHHHPHHHQVHYEPFQSLNSHSHPQGPYHQPLPVTSAAVAGGYMPAPVHQQQQQHGYVPTPTTTTAAPGELEPFPVLGMDLGLGLGLGVQQDPNQFGPGPSSSPQGQHGQGQGQGQYGLVSPQQQQGQQFTPQGSVSPYGHSPSMPQRGFYQL